MLDIQLVIEDAPPEYYRFAGQVRLLLFFPSLQVETCHIRHSQKQSQPFKESIGNSQGTDRNGSLCSGTSGGKENSMRIGIIGAGKVGGGLGKLWVSAGHQVFFSSRHRNRLKVLVEEAGSGAYSGNVADAALFGGVILFSPNFWGVDDALEAAG